MVRVQVGDRVIHYKHGRGVVERLVSQDLAEVRFDHSIEYVQQRNLESLDRAEREAREKKQGSIANESER